MENNEVLNNDSSISSLMVLRKLIANNKELPIGVIKDNLATFEELNELDLKKIVSLIPDDIFDNLEKNDLDKHPLVISKIGLYKGIDIINKIEHSSEDEKDDLEFLLESIRDVESELLGRNYEDEIIDGVVSFEISVLDEKELNMLLEYDIVDEPILYKTLSDQLQDQYFEIFINKGKRINLPLFWLNTKNQNKEKYEKISTLLDASYDYLMCTNYKNEELIRYLFKKIIGHDNSLIIDLFINTRKTNPKLIIPKELLDEYFSFLNIEQLIRFSMADKLSRQKIISLSKTDYGKEIIKYLCMNTSDYVKSIGDFIEKMEQYKELFEDPDFKNRLQNNEEKSQIISKLCKIVLGNSENHFSIETMEDLDDYEESKQYEMRRIFRNLNSLTVEDGQFAILEGLFGIDRVEAVRLVSKYGKYIEDLEDNMQTGEYNLKLYIETLRTILCLKKSEITYLLSDPTFIDYINDGSIFDNAIITNIENALQKLYMEKYKEKMINLGEEYKLPNEIEYKDKKIKVYEIPRKNANGEYEEIDFGMFVRVEGAYGKFETPKSYKEYFEKVEINYHGNCESYINQSMNSFAKTSEDGLIFFYTDCGAILLSAPWDIISFESNNRFNSSRENKTAIRRPLCLTTPDRMADTTRHLHNEFVFERYDYDVEKIKVKRRTPSIVGIQKEEDSMDITKKINEGVYEEQLKAAYDLDIPLLIINRDALAMQEFNRIKRDLKLLENYDNADAKKEKTFEEIMHEIIVRFENNAVGCEYHKSKQERFNSEARKQLIESIVYIIKKGDKLQIDNRFSYLHRILLEEINKQYVDPNQFKSLNEILSGMDYEYEDRRIVITDDEHFEELRKLDRIVPGNIKHFGNLSYIQTVKANIQKLKELNKALQESELLEEQQEVNMGR